MKDLQQKIRELPPDLQRQVEDFIELLKQKNSKEKTGKLKLDWRGALKDLGKKYSSVELQHKLMEWWGD
jgi:hypothetical protein